MMGAYRDNWFTTQQGREAYGLALSLAPFDFQTNDMKQGGDILEATDFLFSIVRLRVGPGFDSPLDWDISIGHRD
jgi:hypothetical protein